MRGCALPLTKLAPPPPHFCNDIIKSFSFPIVPTQHSFPPHSLTIHTPKPMPSTSLSTHHPYPYPHFSSSLHAHQQQRQQQQQDDDEENFQVLTSVRSDYNDIMIVDTPKSRMLLLDSSHNVHSILYKEQKWTNSYWDEFASLPAIVPKGPIAILGLGGGTAAHLMLDLWPSLQLEGWEIDDIVTHAAFLRSSTYGLPYSIFVSTMVN